MVGYTELTRLKDFDNVLIVDENGVVIFYDLADMEILKKLGLRPEEFIGKKITSLYKNLKPENSTLLNAIRTGSSLCNVRQEMLTKTGSSFLSVSSTFPIEDNGRIAGAIEFSKHFFKKESLPHLDKYAVHKIYRKNNTIHTIDDIITEDLKMLAIKNRLARIARTDSTVLINGSTGTGKEVVAQAIHNLSDRYSKPFISLNCGSIPPSLLESTLFGTVKGSFTGAEDMPGLFEQAQGGTLFLDEINSLDIHLQVKILKAIEEKTIRRVGGNRNIHLDIRILSATNEDPEALLAEKMLRQDLYYRLAVVQLDLPSLKERRGDVPLLVEHYIRFYNQQMDIHLDGAADEVLECFMAYEWPGNIRELKNAIETAYNQAASATITMEDIPDRIKERSKTAQILGSESSRRNLKEAVEEFETTLITRELEATHGRLAETARRLGLSKQSLKYKIEKYKLK